MATHRSLRFWRNRGVSSQWFRRSRLLSRIRGNEPPHPLKDWAQRLCGQSDEAAEALLSQWIAEGLSQKTLQTIAASGPATADATPLEIPSHHKLRLLSGCTLKWSAHAWLQHLPVQSLQQIIELQDCRSDSTVTEPTTLLLLDSGLEESPLPVATVLHWWQQVQHADQCLVREPTLAALLQGMGLNNVMPWRCEGNTNGWLEQADVLLHASSRLGLPPAVGLPEAKAMVLGDAGPSWQCSLTDQLMSIPGWDFLLINSAEDARAQAAWLQSLNRNGHVLVCLNPTRPEQIQAGLDALRGDPIRTVLHGEFCQTSLLNELDWLQQGCPTPTIETTPQPAYETLWEHKDLSESTAAVSVCISLYNYGHTILRALESVRRQTLQSRSIDLIVVDDCSTDDGTTDVVAWMQRFGPDFWHCRLIRHNTNGGLAAARNTAFQHANSEWCFVLDADNLLQPNALSNCLKLALETSEECAVVHPWIAVEREQQNQIHQRGGLHGLALWQRDKFLKGNHIDAMAMIRRSAWKGVGGYTHIPGGWEDFDFWCNLIEAGYHGICMPQVVCSYVVHDASMLATSTNSNLRWLCRLMQQRHPWLQLEPEASSPVSGAHRC